jgi:hypothetical protein
MLENVVTALLAQITILGTQLGLVLAGVVVIAVGIYGAKVAWALVTNFVRARQTK